MEAFLFLFSSSFSSVPYLLSGSSALHHTSKECWPRLTLSWLWFAYLMASLSHLDVNKGTAVFVFLLGSYEEAPFCLQAKRTGKWLGALELSPESLTPLKSPFFQIPPFPHPSPWFREAWLYIWQHIDLVVCLKPWVLTMHHLLIVEERWRLNIVKISRWES